MKLTMILILGTWLCASTAKEKGGEDELFKECATATKPVEDVEIVAKEVEVPEFSQEDVSFVGSLSDYWAKVMVMKLQVNALYCYEGGNGDKNTGCHSSTHLFPLTKAEIRESSEENKCKIGTICPPEGDCWGSSASECLDPALYMRNNKADPAALDGTVVPYKRFAYHTCTKNYFCDIQQYKLPIKAETKDGQEVIFSVEVPGKGKYTLSTETDTMETHEDGYNILLPKVQVNPVEGKLGCIYIGKDGRRSCIVTEGPKKNEVLEMDKRCVVSKDNLFLSATCRQHSTEDEKTILFSNKNEDGTSASIRDVREAIKVLHYNDQKSNFNLARTTIQLNVIKRTIREMIIATAARDNRYLGLLMGIPSHSEKQLDGRFTIRGCTEPSTNKTCTRHFNYQNGVWKPKRIDTPCDYEKDPESKKYLEEHKIFLFPEEDLIFSEAQVAKLNGAINEKKKVMRYNGMLGYDNIRDGQGADSGGSSLTDYINPWAIVYRHATFLLAISAFLMSLVTCIRK